MSAVRTIPQSVQLSIWITAGMVALLLVVAVLVNSAVGATAEPNTEPATAYIVSPYAGPFVAGDYLGARPYVSIGSRLDPGTPVGNVQVWRELRPVYSMMRGSIVEVLVGDGTMVMTGQPLFQVQVERDPRPA